MFYTIMQYTNIALVYRMLLVKSTQSLSHRVSIARLPRHSSNLTVTRMGQSNVRAFPIPLVEYLCTN